MIRRAISSLSTLPCHATTQIMASRHFSSAQSSFEKAQADLKTLKEEPDVPVKLQLYALFKQASVGDVSGSRPGMTDFAGRAKYDSHSKLKGMSKEDAMTNYVELVKGLLTG